MSIELQYALVAVSGLAMFWWVYHLAFKSRAPRKKPVSKKLSQPWGNDKDSGRSNR